MNEHMSRCRLRTYPFASSNFGGGVGLHIVSLRAKKQFAFWGFSFFGLIGRVSRSGIPVQRMGAGVFIVGLVLDR